MGDGLQTFNTSIAQTSKLLDEMNLKMSKLNADILENNKANMSQKIGLSETGKEMSKNVIIEEKNIKVKQLDSKATKELNSDYLLLKKTLTDQAQRYSDLYIARGKYDAQTKAALRDYQSTAAIVNGIDNQLAKAGGGAAGLGRNLTTAFGHLRNLAYILPGLGIAGIFNLAFEAIGSAVSSLGLFNDKVTEAAKRNTDFNTRLSEQISLYYELNKLREDYLQNFGGYGDATFTEKQLNDAIDEARGIAKDKLLPQQISTAQSRADKAAEDVGGSVASEKEFSEGLFKRMEAAAESIKEINSIRANILSTGLFKPDDLKKLDDHIKSKQSDYDIAKLEYENSQKKIKEYYDSNQDLDTKKAAYTKFLEDESRKLKLENAKSEISVNIEKNKAILSDDKKFHNDKADALKASYEQEIALNSAIYENVKNNNSSTEVDKRIAAKKLEDDNLKASIKLKQDLEKNDVEFYQRYLLATTEIKKDQIEQSSIADERIYLNEKHSLEERLDAYENYIIKRQQMKDLEYNLSIQRGASKDGGKTSLTPEEQERINVHRSTQKFNIQADAEKQTYNIVKSYLDQKLKLVEDANEKESDIDREAYAKELSANNERFKNKIFQYEAFKRNYDFINKKYKVILSVEDEIKDDEEDISRLKTLYEDLIKLKKESDDSLLKRKGDLDNEKLKDGDVLNSERFYNEELGRNNALNDAILKSKKDLNDAIKKGEDDKVKQAKARYEQLIQFEKEYSDNNRKIKDSLWNFAQDFVNRNVENELRAINDVQRARDEQFSLQQNAIEDSSLNAKDKTALEIQLNQQKIESDKAADAEERKIKREAAEIDKKLSLARVIMNGIESVSSALKLPPPAGEIIAAQRGILAAIAAAQIIATPIPSYAEGTDFHPGGKARYAENGAELIKEPGRPAYVQLTETISYLPKGTQVIPIKDNSPEFTQMVSDESWEQTRFLAKQIKKSNKEVINVFKPTIIIDGKFESRKSQILGN